jgi:hypothetical protein
MIKRAYLLEDKAARSSINAACHLFQRNRAACKILVLGNEILDTPFTLNDALIAMKDLHAEEVSAWYFCFVMPCFPVPVLDPAAYGLDHPPMSLPAIRVSTGPSLHWLRLPILRV